MSKTGKAGDGGIVVRGKMNARQRRAIYGMATQIGIYEKGNKDDDLHTIVWRLTGKESIGHLTSKEANLVIGELSKLKRCCKSDRGGKPQGHRAGMISKDQERAVWYYMYRLEEMDETPSQLSRAERLCAVIKKYLHVDTLASDPFRFISFKAAGTLIEVLKNIVRYEERKA